MPGPAKNKTEQTARELEVWRLRLKCWTVTAIGEAVGLHHGTICRILQRINKRELERLSAEVELVKAEQTGQISHLVSEASRAWEHSLQPENRVYRRTERTRGPGKNGALLETEIEHTESVERDGDPRFLMVILAGLAAIRGIWGLNPGPKGDAAAAEIAEIARGLAERVQRFQDRQQAKEPPAG
jgi:hypothetical protein